MASKFFAEDDEVESQHSDDNLSEVEEEKKQQIKKPLMYFSESSDEDEKRVVKTQKDKMHESLREIIDKIKDKIKIKDFSAIHDHFDELNRQLEKSKKVVDKEGVPLFYIRICWVLENMLNNFSAEEKKSLKAANNKAYNTLKHKVKKNNKNYETQISNFAKNPVFSEDEPKIQKKGKTDADSDDERKPKNDTKGGDESSSESEWDKQKGEESESESDEDDKKYLLSQDPQERRKYWLKKTKDVESDKDSKQDEEEAKKKQALREARAKARREREDAEMEAKFSKQTQKKVSYTQEQMDKKIQDIIERRAGKKTSKEGKKLTVEDDLQILQNILEEIKGDQIRRLEILLVLMPTRFDCSRLVSSVCMPRAYWTQNFENLLEFFNIIRNSSNDLSIIRTFQKDLDTYYKESSILESFSTHFEGLENELYKAFKTIEPTTIEYSERLRDQAQMSKLAADAMEFYSSRNDIGHEIQFAAKRIEYIYYITDNLHQKLKTKALETSTKDFDGIYTDKDLANLIHGLATKIYRHSKDEKMITKTMLYQIYNHSINGRYQIAKDFMLMAHLQENCQSADTSIQILYNRVLVQLGLCAFRNGLIQEALHALSEIVSLGKTRELLAQGISKNPQNEKEERRRLLPYHYHINVELIEAAHLICAMLIEVPIIVADPAEAAKKTKFFRKVYENAKNFYGPPDSYRDYVLVAAKELHQGNWKKCYQNLMSINIWNKLGHDQEQAKQNLLARVKEQALKCYLFTFQTSYDSLGLDHIAKLFEIDRESLHSMISKLIFSREFRAHLDLETDCLMFEKVQNTKLQDLALHLSDKISAMLVSNEKILDSKFGNYGYTDKDVPEHLLKKKQTMKRKPNLLAGKNKKTYKKN